MSRLRDNLNQGPRRLRSLVSRGYLIVPGVFDGISAIMAEEAGFDAIYLSGSGIAGKYGLPDLSLTTLTEVSEETARICSISSIPLIVDADTGFGETLNVIRATRLIESSGASAIQIEDQEAPKRCGHLDGKSVIPEEEMVKKIKAAVSARKSKDFMIIARTDSYAIEGHNGAVRRAKAYARAGADVIFPEALPSASEFKKFYADTHLPLLANMTEFGKSPLLSAQELGRIGYKIIIFPLTAFRASLLSMRNTYSYIRRHGSQVGMIEKLMERNSFYETIGYDSYTLEDRKLYGEDFSSSSKKVNAKRK
jgi:methylisocitrate lyase